MATVHFTVPAISCDHCVNTVVRAVKEVPGVQTATAEVETKKVEVVFEPPATRQLIVAAMTEWDYPPAP